MSPVALADTVSNGNGYSHHNAAAPNGLDLNGPIEQQPVDPTAARRPVESIEVESDNLTYSDDALLAQYTFHSTAVNKSVDENGQAKYKVKPVEKHLEFRTERKVPKTG